MTEALRALSGSRSLRRGAGQLSDAAVRLVVGFGAGGPTDIPARYIADKLGTLLGQRVIVENKTGAAGMLATRDVLAQPADGYNLLLCTHFESINTVSVQEPGVQARRPRADFADRADTTTASRSPTRFRPTASNSSCNTPSRIPAR